MFSLTTTPNTTNYYSATTESDMSSYAGSSYSDSDGESPSTTYIESNVRHELELDASSNTDAVSDFESRPMAGSMIIHPNFYRAEAYTLTRKTFEELPETTQKFLTKMGLHPVDESAFERGVFFETLYNIREARRDRLERTLEGVNRAIAKEVLTRVEEAANEVAAEPTRDMAAPGAGPHQNLVSRIFYPEWQEHLEAYVEEIDALIWVDMDLRLGVESNLSLQGYMREREEDVERMVEFAVQCLQRAFERVKEERGMAWLLKKITEGNKDGAAKEGEDSFDSMDSIAHISPVSPLSGGEGDAQWVTQQRE